MVKVRGKASLRQRSRVSRVMLAFSLAAIACGLTSRSDDDRPSPASSGATSAGTTSTGGGGGNTDRANGGVETHDGGGDGGVGGGGSDDVDYDPGYCGGPLTFRLERVEVDAGITLCNGLPGGIDPIWFWLLDSEGETFPAFPGCSDKLCGSCSGGCLLLGRFSSPVPAEGIEQQWAVHQLLDDSCDGSACKYPICAPAGEYIARFCGYPVKSADGIGGFGGAGDPLYNPCSAQVAVEPTCVEVPFTLPRKEPVVGQITL